MTRVRIFRPSKTAMQSGRAKTGSWILEFESTSQKFVEPLMGWIGSADTRSQLRLKFDSRDAAVAYAEKNGFEYEVRDKPRRHIKPKSYAENFAFERRI